MQDRPNTFEYDDYPQGRGDFLELADSLKRRFPGFRCDIFAVPEQMSHSDMRQLQLRADWMRVHPHGFAHKKGECRLERPGDWPDRLQLLDRLAADNRWGRAFKPPWHGSSPAFVEQLHQRGFFLAAKTLQGLPYPMPGRWRLWSVSDAYWSDSRYQPQRRHVEAHPVYISRRSYKSFPTEMSALNVATWSEYWSPEDEWEWVQPRPACLKINVGCGPQVWDDWACLDNRHTDPRVRRWEMYVDGQLRHLPYSDNKADVILTSHLLNYVAEEDYANLLLDFWRVLRAGAVLRMQEDATDTGYVWRRPGQKARGTGTIRSLPTQQKIVDALSRVGFEVHISRPGETLSPHADVLLGDSRARRWRRGHKFVLEAVKNIKLGRLNRVRHSDVRAGRKHIYRLPEELERDDSSAESAAARTLSK